jgi:hypothetical protein
MSPRLAHLDTVKVLLVVGVIAMHTAITYGLDGSWYLESDDQMSAGLVDVVGSEQFHLQLGMSPQYVILFSVGVAAVLVGLAFVVQPLPLPAEVKFLVVLLAGVAGSFGLTELARRRVLDHRGEAHADADAHRRDSVAGAAAA